jgi:asparagine synthase (glutamine-hydrolysing)
MCGIAGVAWADRRRPGDAALVESMAAVLRHRGPDGKGLHVGPGIGLGVRRLAVIDLVTGAQPIANEDGTVTVVCNGEIYNHAELRLELTARGHRFRSTSDVEVIVHLYEELGLDSVGRLRGMFALALWDAGRRRLWLVRDRLGIKPLHYALTAEGLYFGSEMKAVLAAGIEASAFDVRAMDELFTFGFVPDPRTLLHAVRRLGAGQWLLYEGGRVTLRPYWRYGDVAVSEDRASARVWAERLREKLEETVRLHLRADVPVGGWLSGGIDSSAVVSLARRLAGPLPTFTLAFDDAAYDETRGQRTLDRVPGYEHPNERIPCGSRALERYPEALWHTETPAGGMLGLLRLILSERAARRVKVVLTGEGADEVLGGYLWFLIDRLFRPIAALPVPVRRAVLLGPLGPARRAFARRLLSGPRSMGVERYARLVGPLGGERRRTVFSADIQHELAADDGVDGDREPAGPAGQDPFVRLQQLDLSLRLPAYINLTLDGASMAYGLEARVPFLDHELVELCAQIPLSLKLRGLREKYVLRRALEGALPSEILWRRKRPLMAPIETWLRGPLPAFAGELLSPAGLRATGYFEPAAVQGLVADVRAGRGLDARLLLMVLGVQLWDVLFRHPAAPPGTAAVQRSPRGGPSGSTPG